MKFAIMRACGLVLGGCLTLALVGCATTSEEPVAPRPNAIHPKIVKLSFVGGLTATAEYLVADGTTAWVESHEPENPHDATTRQVVKRTTRNPTAQQWNRFWRKFDRMHIERWKKSYDPTQVAGGMIFTDGGGWALTVATTHQTFRSKGYEAFPVLGHPDRTVALFDTEEMKRHPTRNHYRENMLDQLTQAFDELLQSPSVP